MAPPARQPLLRPVQAVLLAALSACAPVEPELPDLSPPEGADHLVIAIHGAGDTPATWPDRAVDEILTVADDPRWHGVALDWSEVAEARTKAAARGLVVGDALGAELARHPWTHVHLVGHSAGAFVVHAATLALADAAPDTTIHATYLDAFVLKGLAAWTWGTDRFGEGADWADHHVHRGDGVPATAATLTHAWNHDVTDALQQAPKRSADAHWWPISWYLGSAGTAVGLGASVETQGATALESHDPYPRGDDEPVSTEDQGLATTLDVDPDAG